MRDKKTSWRLDLTVDKLELQDAQDLGVVVALLLEDTSCAV